MTDEKKNHPYKIGEIYFIRTVTFYFAGRLKEVFENELVLTEASWISETGRFNESLKDASLLDEVEMYPDDTDVIIGRGAIIDVSIPAWEKLPSTTK